MRGFFKKGMGHHAQKQGDEKGGHGHKFPGLHFPGFKPGMKLPKGKCIPKIICIPKGMAIPKGMCPIKRGMIKFPFMFFRGGMHGKQQNPNQQNPNQQNPNQQIPNQQINNQNNQPQNQPIINPNQQIPNQTFDPNNQTFNPNNQPQIPKDQSTELTILAQSS